MDMLLKYHVDSKNSGRKVRSILKNEFKFSSSLIKKLKYNRKIFYNGVPVYVNHVVKAGDIIEAHIHFEERSDNVKPVKMDLHILYEDDCVIALDKPDGLIVHPSPTDPENTIANGLKYYFESKGERIKVRPVSRLDRGTTGVIVFAKNQFIQERLKHQMKTKQYHKEYIGIVHGCPPKASGTIDLPIARAPDSIILREVSESGAPSVTHYSVLSYLDNAAVMRFILETGRTHQIRVHCQAICHPLIGDTLYSDISADLISRQALHSHYVSFTHPVTGERTEIVSPLPQDMRKLLESVKKGKL
ncbi:MAG: RluA family pseudouridine synthase [Clostridia bacterium]